MSKATKVILAIIILVVVVVGTVMLFGGDSSDNMKNKDVNNVPAQDLNDTSSPDPVKQNTGDNNDTDQSSTGNGGNLQSSD